MQNLSLETWCWMLSQEEWSESLDGLGCTEWAVYKLDKKPKLLCLCVTEESFSHFTPGQFSHLLNTFLEGSLLMERDGKLLIFTASLFMCLCLLWGVKCYEFIRWLPFDQFASDLRFFFGLYYNSVISCVSLITPKSYEYQLLKYSIGHRFLPEHCIVSQMLMLSIAELFIALSICFIVLVPSYKQGK